jgi:hypothetical protein
MAVEITIVVRNTTDTGPTEIRQKYLYEELKQRYLSDWRFELCNEIERMIAICERDIKPLTNE